MLQRNKITQTLTLGAVQQLWFFNDLTDYGNNIVASEAAINAAVRIEMFLKRKARKERKVYIS